MQKKTINSQFNNFKSYLMYLRQCRSLAENVFLFENLPEYVDVAYINKILVEKGSIAWFKDEVMGLLALPWVRQGNLDVYGRPTTIRVYGTNGYTKVLNVGEYVIMYDNYGKYPLLLDITQYAQRLANCVRVQDINVSQQKTPRYWKTSQDNVESIKGLLNKIDSDENAVIGYEDIDIDNTQCVLEPAPYVTDKLDDYKNNIFNEFLRLIGVANLTVQKKERNIKDEVLASQGGTIASRFSRFEPRKKAVDLINEKFDVDIQVKFFDGLPTSLDTFEDKVEENLEDQIYESEVE
jgi:hypothetical protein